MSFKKIGYHVNGEGERISVDLVPSGKFKGERILVIHDDPPPNGTGTKAPMLLDESTVEWLLSILDPSTPPTH